MINLRFGSVRLISLVLLLGGLFLSYGCTTFGTFASLKQNKSTSEEVRELLGEPEEVRSQDESDIWKYTFDKSSRANELVTAHKLLKTEISFQDGIMTDYQITVVTKIIPENVGRKPLQENMMPGIRPERQPGISGLNPKAHKFLEKFDTNRDGHITKKEYLGPPKLFNLLDSNHNNIIEFIELKNFSFKK